MKAQTTTSQRLAPATIYHNPAPESYGLQNPTNYTPMWDFFWRIEDAPFDPAGYQIASIEMCATPDFNLVSKTMQLVFTPVELTEEQVEAALMNEQIFAGSTPYTPSPQLADSAA